MIFSLVFRIKFWGMSQYSPNLIYLFKFHILIDISKSSWLQVLIKLPDFGKN